MNRTEKLNRYCEGRKKHYVAEKELGVSRQALSYLLRIDIDDLVRRIDALPVEEKRRRRAA
jgi:hypothetical protein